MTTTMDLMCIGVEIVFFLVKVIGTSYNLLLYPICLEVV